MRILVLGGTVFLSKWIADYAVRAGHEVFCAARGRSGTVPDGAKLITVDRDAGLAALAGARFDAVLDVATFSHPWVTEALRVLGPTTGHWSFVSSISVYADSRTRGQGVDAPLLDPIQESTDRETMMRDARGAALYGGIKVASEHAVADALGDRACITRPGLIVGPGDWSNRFGYWPARISRGGRVLVPDAPEQPTQFVDVRDYAAFLVRAAEQRITGTFDVIRPSLPLGETLSMIVDAVGPADTELVALAPEALTKAGVSPWSGPRSLPLWLPADHWGMSDHDPAPVIAAGLTARSFTEVVRDARDHELTLAPGDRGAGLSAAEEARLLGTC